LVKMVNALTSKSSIGGPMACMHLLGHPDVYCSHDIVTVYWYQHIQFVLVNVDDSIVPVDRVQDYCLRPQACGPMSLWDWWRRSNKCKSSNKMRQERKNASSTVHGYVPIFGADRADKQVPCLGNDTLDDSNSVTPVHEATQLLFLQEHAQFMTHHINIAPDSIDVVLNLSGGSLPRRDRGNTEEYCMTMLAFFKPWRSARDLKRVDQTWQQAFDSHSWTDRDVRFMMNMHVKYECNDARDDYNAQLKQGHPAIKKFQDGMDDRSAADLMEDGTLTEIMSLLTTEERLQALEGHEGKCWLDDLEKMNTISATLQAVGWLD
ncbi:uncharacterized protein STEHIDRAFT_35865, partial [Stereum hirsutum FP-91666 SS1]